MDSNALPVQGRPLSLLASKKKRKPPKRKRNQRKNKTTKPSNKAPARIVLQSNINRLDLSRI